MKRFLVMSVLALGMVALSQQHASAWIKLSIGFNFSFESGNNNLLWGFFRDGQLPGYPTDVLHGHHPFAIGGYGGYDHGSVVYDSHSGTNGHGQGQGQGQGGQNGKQSDESKTTATRGYGWYQPVSYSPGGYVGSSGYSYPSYHQPYGYYNHSYQQAPSYWYGY
ncbi:MAG: hypothetical protein L0Z62_44495 [Gemmataceae bacterium]|nr:hypothetical protein [Gemmataceae bacterium]